MQKEGGVMHLSLRLRRITPSSMCIHILLSLIPELLKNIPYWAESRFNYFSDETSDHSHSLAPSSKITLKYQPAVHVVVQLLLFCFLYNFYFLLFCSETSIKLACPKRSNKGEKREPSFFPTFFRSLFSTLLPYSSHLSPLPERLEQATIKRTLN